MQASFLATLLFSISAVSARRSVAHLGSITANVARLALAALLLGLWAHTAGDGLSGTAAWVFFLSGVIGFGFGDIALFHALPRLGSRLSILFTQCLAVPIAIPVEWLWLGTDLAISTMAFSAVVLAGILVALLPRKLPEGVGCGQESAARTRMLGILFGIGSAAGQGLGAVVSRKAYGMAHTAGEFPDGMTAAYQRILGGLLIAALFYLLLRRRESATRPSAAAAGGNPPLLTAAESLASTGRKSGPKRLRPAILLLIAINALSGPVLGVSAYQWALGTTPSGVVLSIVALTPITVIPLAFLLEGDRPTTRSLVGGLIAVTGAIGLAWVG